MRLCTHSGRMTAKRQLQGTVRNWPTCCGSAATDKWKDTMSTKSTITFLDAQTASYHLYSEIFSDSIHLDYSPYSGDVHMTMGIPLKLALQIAETLPRHLAPIKELLEATDEELRIKAQVQWEKNKEWAKTSKLPFAAHMVTEGITDEQGIQDCFQDMKERQTLYRKLMNEENSQVSQ